MASLGRRVVSVAQKNFYTRNSIELFTKKKAFISTQSAVCGKKDIVFPLFDGFKADATIDDSPVVTHSNIYNGESTEIIQYILNPDLL